MQVTGINAGALNPAGAGNERAAERKTRRQLVLRDG